VTDVARTTDISTMLVRGDLCLAWKLVEMFLGVTHDACSLVTLLLLWWTGSIIARCCCLFGGPLRSLGDSHPSGGSCKGEERKGADELGDEESERVDTCGGTLLLRFAQVKVKAS